MTLRFFTVVCAAALVLAAAGGARADEQRAGNILDERGEYACLSSGEAQLLAALNEYRTSHRLRPVGNSRALTMVARMHAVDLVENRPERGTDARGVPCNLHSWSDRGFWCPVCYTADHRQLMLMLNKPAEITGGRYRDFGYENVFWTSAPAVSPLQIMDSWRGSPEHRAVILEEGIWAGSRWSALGVGIHGNVAVIWLGSTQDPLGPLPSCGATAADPEK